MASPKATRKPAPKRPTKKPAPRMLTRAQVPAAVQTMAQPSGSARFRAGKTLAITAAKDPSRVYPHFDTLAGLLASDSKIVRWNAMQILGLLAPVAPAPRLDPIVDTFLTFLCGDNMITAANAIREASRIALSRPALLERIVPAILKVETATYETAECRNVVIGQVLDALQEHWPSTRLRPDVAAFVRRQRTNTRQAVARHATELASDCPDSPLQK